MTPAIGVFGLDPQASGNLKCNGIPVPNAEVAVAWVHTVPNPPGFFIQGATTDGAGNYSLVIQDLPASSEFIAVWDGNTACPDGAESEEFPIVGIRPGVLANANKPEGSPNGTVITFKGQVLPRHPGKIVYVMLLDGQTLQWKPLATFTMDSDSRYTATYKKRSNSTLWFRIAYPTQDSEHLWNWSRVFKI